MLAARRHVNPSTQGVLLQLARARNEDLVKENHELREQLATARKMLDDALALAALNEQAAAASAAKAKSLIAAQATSKPPHSAAHVRAFVGARCVPPSQPLPMAAARTAAAAAGAAAMSHCSSSHAIGRGYGGRGSGGQQRAALSTARATSAAAGARSAVATAHVSTAAVPRRVASASAGSAPSAEELERRRLSELAAREAVAARQAQMAAAVVRLQSGARGFNVRAAIRQRAAEGRAATLLQAVVRGNEARGIADRRRFARDENRRRLVHRHH